MSLCLVNKLSCPAAVKPPHTASFCCCVDLHPNHGVFCRYGDMRVMMGCEIFSMWQNLGEISEHVIYTGRSFKEEGSYSEQSCR